MKIEMNLTMMAKLINQGVITPSEVRCLDEDSKQQLRELCLDLCKPSQCSNCDAQSYCSKDLYSVAATSKNRSQIISSEIESTFN